MPKALLTRRTFLRSTALAGAGVFFIGRGGQAQPAHNKLNIGIVGVANRAGENLRGVSGENIVALCDVDANFLEAAAANHPGAAKYRDFRKMIERNDLDAVVVSTTDHVHAVATAAALKTGRHVYCEKPLTHTVSEARAVAELARQHKRVTQMGTQIHAGENYRRVVELIQAGAIGPVREVHNWVGAVWSGQNQAAEPAPVPAHLDWDLWLGPATERPYSPAYHPARWRGYWAFGGGAMSDMACHHMDLPFWALGLRHPLTVQAEGPEVHPDFAPHWLVVRYEYPARGAQPPLKLTWYNGGKRPEQIEGEKLKRFAGGGTLFVGDQGMLVSNYDAHLLLPEDKFADYKRPEPTIPKSIGHHAEWIQACKTGGPTTCNFDYAGALTEAVLLGNVSFRSGKRLEWDPKELRAKNAPAATQYIQHHYRKNWSL
jgi:predicted dehydrogenase